MSYSSTVTLELLIRDKRYGVTHVGGSGIVLEDCPAMKGGVAILRTSIDGRHVDYQITIDEIPGPDVPVRFVNHDLPPQDSAT